MKVTINEKGLMLVEPESALEAYALQHWSREAIVQQQDLARVENCHWRGSKLIVSGDWKST